MPYETDRTLAPPEGLVHEAREVMGDVHHGLRQEKARGDADALAHVYERARDAGATPEQLSQITGGFTRIAEALLEQGPKRRRAPWRARTPRRKPGPELPAARSSRQLPRRSSAPG